jgi:hypothetical protein
MGCRGGNDLETATPTFTPSASRRVAPTCLRRTGISDTSVHVQRRPQRHPNLYPIRLSGDRPNLACVRSFGQSSERPLSPRV